MGKIKAGVVLVTKFVRPGDKAFGGYIDYIDREEAVRNDYSEEWNGYVDYMGNPEKTSELFSAGSDCLSAREKRQLKEDFISAQENGNLMWQSVLSFDNRWLEEQGLYDSHTNTLNKDKLKELTRNCMDKMLVKEGIDQSAVWSAAIHYNTDHIHIHIATVEPHETLRPMRDNGEPKGVWRQSTLNAGKSVVINGILLQQEENLMINNLIRQNIVGAKKMQRIAWDKDFRQAFLKVYENLPQNKQYWNYSSTNLGNQNRKDLDELSKLYIEKFHRRDFEAFQELVKKQQDKYQEAYGSGEKTTNQYANNKERELYKRLGNTILKEMKEYDREIKIFSNSQMLNYRLAGEIGQKALNNQSLKRGFQIIGYSMNRIGKNLKRDIQSMKNLTEYEKLEQRIERNKNRQEYEV